MNADDPVVLDAGPRARAPASSSSASTGEPLAVGRRRLLRGRPRPAPAGRAPGDALPAGRGGPARARTSPATCWSRRRRRGSWGPRRRRSRARCAPSAASSTCSSTWPRSTGSRTTTTPRPRTSRPRAAAWRPSPSRCSSCSAGGTRAGTSASSPRRSRAHGRRVLAIGEARERVEAALGGAVPVDPCASLREAVERAHAAARPGDVVLLAPACSSFDMFADYADRGRAFKAEVRRLAGGGAVAKKLSTDLAAPRRDRGPPGLRPGHGLERVVRARAGAPRQPLLLPPEAGGVGRPRPRRHGGGAAPRLPDAAPPRRRLLAAHRLDPPPHRRPLPEPGQRDPPLDPDGGAELPARRAREARDGRSSSPTTSSGAPSA